MEMDERRELYDMLAAEDALVAEVVGGKRTFSEELEHIVEDVKEGQPGSLRDFFTWYVPVSELTYGKHDDRWSGIAVYYTFHSKSATKELRIKTLTMGGISGAVTLLGNYLDRVPKMRELALFMRVFGGVGLGISGVYLGVNFLSKAQDGPDVKRSLEMLSEAAGMLDEEVEGLYSQPPPEEPMEIIDEEKVFGDVPEEEELFDDVPEEPLTKEPYDIIVEESEEEIPEGVSDYRLTSGE